MTRTDVLSLPEYHERVKLLIQVRNRDIHKLRSEGKTLAEIGKIFGITRQRVAQIIQSSDRETENNQ